MAYKRAKVDGIDEMESFVFLICASYWEYLRNDGNIRIFTYSKSFIHTIIHNTYIYTHDGRIEMKI